MAEANNPFTEMLHLIELHSKDEHEHEQNTEQYPSHESPLYIVTDWPEYNHDAVVIDEEIGDSGETREHIRYDGPLMERADA